VSAVIDHIAVLLLHAARDRGDSFGIFVDKIPEVFEQKYGLVLAPTMIDSALEKLRGGGAVRNLPSELAGDLVKISPRLVLNYFGDDATEPGPNTSSEYDDRYEAAHANLPVMNAYGFGGQEWVDRVVARLQSSEFDGVSRAPSTQVPVPAADRIVTLGHNQQADIEAAADEVIAELSKENSIGGDTSLRERFLAELSAGRELVRAPSVRAYLLYDTLVRVLGMLIERYKDQAIAEAAKKLLGLLIEHIFGK